MLQPSAFCHTQEAFQTQVKFTGALVKHHPGLGDITFEVGFVIAAVVYGLLFTLTRADRAR